MDQLSVLNCTLGFGVLSGRNLGGIFRLVQLLLSTQHSFSGDLWDRPARNSCTFSSCTRLDLHAFSCWFRQFWLPLSVSGTLCCNHKSETSSAAAVSQATVTTPPGLTTRVEQLPHSTMCPARLAQQWLFKKETPRTLCFNQKTDYSCSLSV